MDRRDWLKTAFAVPPLWWLSGCALFDTATLVDFHVAADGSDASGDGTAERPWRQIDHALARIPAEVRFPRVLVGPGEYVRQLRIRRDAVIIGAGPDRVRLRSHLAGEPVVDVTGPGFSVRIENVALDGDQNRSGGLVARAAGLRLRNVRVLQPRLCGIWVEDCPVYLLEDCGVSTGENAPLFTDMGLNLVRSQGTVSGLRAGDRIDHVVNVIGGAATIVGAELTGSPVWYADGIRIQSAANVTVRDCRIVRPPGGEVVPEGRVHNPPYAGIEVAAPRDERRRVLIEDVRIAGFDVGVGVNLTGNALRLRRVRIDSAREACVRLIQGQQTHGGIGPAPAIDLGRPDDPGANHFGRDAPYALYHQAAYDVPAHGNDWDSPAADIERRIHDRLDDPRLGRVLR